MAKLHLAESEEDAAPTACGKLAGQILAETDDEITLDSRELLTTANVCLECYDQAEEVEGR